MILSNIKIHEAIKEVDIDISPQPNIPSINNPRNSYDTTAVDLTLSDTLQIPQDGLAITLDLSSGNIAKTLTTLCKIQTIDPQTGYQLNPGKFVLAQTREVVHLPIREGRPVYAARVEGKSSRARCAILVHFTAPTVHAGFHGPLTLEMINLGNYIFTLKPDMPICQLIFETVDGSPVENPSQFQNQKTPACL
jgi:dCTP deaminase